MRGLTVFLIILLLAVLLFTCTPSSKPTPTPEPTHSPTSATTPVPAQTPPSTPSLTPTPIPTPTPETIAWVKPSSPVTLTINSSDNRATFTSGGAQISGYYYRPQGAGPFPAVLVLHGRAGLQEVQRLYSIWLATQGYVAFAPDYFAPINMPSGTWAGTDYPKYTDRIREDLGQGLEALKSLSYVDSNRLGIVGFSLGGYYAFILATRNDVTCIVSYYGAYAGPPVNRTPVKYTVTEIVNQVKAPVLMFHGDKDAMIPITNANAVNELLKNTGKSCEYIIYTGAGHAFGEPYATTAEVKVLTFLKAKMQ